MTRDQKIICDGFELHYCIKGQGEPILVVGSSVYYPRLFSENLSQHFQLIFLDHRGFVKPPRPLKQEDYTLEKIVDDIEQARQLLKLEHFIILGHSGHAFMAMAYANTYPQHVRKVILLNTATTNSQERQQQSLSFFDANASVARKKQFERDIAFLAQDLKKEPERRFVHMCIRMGAHSFYDYSFNATAMWEGVYTNMEVIDYLWGRAFAEQDLLQLTRSFPKPVFVGLGRYDFLVAPVSLWEAIEDTSQVKKVIFEQSGHNPMFEEPELFDEQLISWINEG
ncbi:MAG: alpha/beta hydrolase [Lysinibacillus fusiformis]|uniref:alpha/beta fold hydrolase n=1 Tax=Lysinibacillus fusiformis TaxID=28031 RepID=UPI000502C6BD|nr:alpha/beta hydrolase [Lysinibacillus fusiformis]KAB0443919.1 alpha/beta hydrolase [Lysinibacillus fusiformis]KGA80756.1 alpha/beta hydrolase [Lysinibacillus fusiformis]MCE4044061.1 alpha/beta hydrolase [Lysinibacillus fusiformis]MCT6818383.1 alpha/beta hydrolase [Lysinibacillus fusiformis]MCT6927313.1 alpha/beta hydrolase [Lysinibacillus fusiformis]